MNTLLTKVGVPIVAAVLVALAALTGSTHGGTPGGTSSGRLPAGETVISWAGQGRIESTKPQLAGSRYEGRFVVFGLGSATHAILPPDAPLFDSSCVGRFGAGVQCAYLVAIRDGAAEDGFLTGDDSADFPGQENGWSTPQARVQVFFDPHPDGSRSFDDRASFTRGTLVATYAAREYFELDSLSKTFYTRVSYRALSGRSFVMDGERLNLTQLAPSMSEAAMGHNPTPDPMPETVPLDVPTFQAKGPGIFANRFTVSGTVTAAG